MLCSPFYKYSTVLTNKAYFLYFGFNFLVNIVSVLSILDFETCFRDGQNCFLWRGPRYYFSIKRYSDPRHKNQFWPFLIKFRDWSDLRMRYWVSFWQREVAWCQFRHKYIALQTVGITRLVVCFEAAVFSARSIGSAFFFSFFHLGSINKEWMKLPQDLVARSVNAVCIAVTDIPEGTLIHRSTKLPTPHQCLALIDRGSASSRTNIILNVGHWCEVQGIQDSTDIVNLLDSQCL